MQSFVTELARGDDVVGAPSAATSNVAVGDAAPAVAATPIGVVAAIDSTEARTEAVRQCLASEWARLAQLLDPQWQKFLELPPGVVDPAQRSSPAEVAAALARFEQVAASPEFAALVARPEFQSTKELLANYSAALNAGPVRLQLPPPPPVAAEYR